MFSKSARVTVSITVLRDHTLNRFWKHLSPQVLQKRLAAPIKSLKAHVQPIRCRDYFGRDRSPQRVDRCDANCACAVATGAHSPYGTGGSFWSIGLDLL